MGSGGHTRDQLAVGLALALAIGVAAAPLAAQAQPPAPPGSSWIEAGGYYHHVTGPFGDWRGGYARGVFAGARDVWYLDARAQRAFNDDGVYGSIANVHTWTSRFYMQLGVGAGTGRYVLPALREDLSLNFKLGRARSVILTVGETYVDSHLIYEDKAFFGSLSWYAGGTVLVEAGGRVNWSNPGSVRSGRGSGALTLGRFGGSQVTLRGGAGTEGYQLIGLGTPLRMFSSQEASGALRQWLSGGWGMVLQGDWYHNPFYTRTGGQLGLFRAW